MTDVWISTKKHFCQACQCWLSGHSRNIDAHEKTPGHKANQQRILHNMHIKERQKQRDAFALHSEINRIEQAALNSFQNKPNKIRKIQVSDLPTGAIGPKLKDSRTSEVFLHQKSNITQDPLKLNCPTSKSSVIAKALPEQVFSRPPLSKSVWLGSIDSETKKPFYFNTVTGEIRKDNPSDIIETGGFGDSNNAKAAYEQKTDSTISSFLPTVNALADAYRKHIRSKQELPKEAESFTKTSVSSDQARVISSKTALPYTLIETQTSLLKEKTDFSLSQNAQETVKLQQGIKKDKFIRTGFVDKLVAEETVKKKPKINESTGVGEWEEVNLDDSKFGAPSLHIDEDKIVEKDQLQINHGAVETQAKICFDTLQLNSENNEAEDPSTRLTVLKNKFSRSDKILTEDDLVKHSKSMFFNDDSPAKVSSKIVFKKRAPVQFKKQSI